MDRQTGTRKAASRRGTEKRLAQEDRLLRGFAAAEPGAIEELWQFVFALLIVRLKNPDDAADATQEVIVKAARSLLDFRRDCKFRTWLRSIAVRHAATIIRQAARCARPRFTPAARRLQERQQRRQAGSPEDDLLQQEAELMVERLRDAISRLNQLGATPRMERVCNMWIKNKTFREIAKELRVCEATVRKEMRCVQALLRRALTAEGIHYGDRP